MSSSSISSSNPSRAYYSVVEEKQRVRASQHKKSTIFEIARASLRDNSLGLADRQLIKTKFENRFKNCFLGRLRNSVHKVWHRNLIQELKTREAFLSNLLKQSNEEIVCAILDHLPEFDAIQGAAKKNLAVYIAHRFSKEEMKQFVEKGFHGKDFAPFIEAVIESQKFLKHSSAVIVNSVLPLSFSDEEERTLALVRQNGTIDGSQKRAEFQRYLELEVAFKKHKITKQSVAQQLAELLQVQIENSDVEQYRIVKSIRPEFQNVRYAVLEDEKTGKRLLLAAEDKKDGGKGLRQYWISNQQTLEPKDCESKFFLIQQLFEVNDVVPLQTLFPFEATKRLKEEEREKAIPYLQAIVNFQSSSDSQKNVQNRAYALLCEWGIKPVFTAVEVQATHFQLTKQELKILGLLKTEQEKKTVKDGKTSAIRPIPVKSLFEQETKTQNVQQLKRDFANTGKARKVQVQEELNKILHACNKAEQLEATIPIIEPPFDSIFQKYNQDKKDFFAQTKIAAYTLVADAQADFERAKAELFGVFKRETGILPQLDSLYYAYALGEFKGSSPILEPLKKVLDAEQKLQKANRVLKYLNEKGSVKEEEKAKVASELRSKLAEKREYTADDPPHLQVFEILLNIHMRSEQVAHLKTLLEDQSIALQLLMGGGKTAVLLPLLGLLKADGTRLSTILLPENILSSEGEKLRSKLSGFFDRVVYEFPDLKAGAPPDFLESIYNNLELVRQSSGCLFTTPQRRHAFFNHFTLALERASRRFSEEMDNAKLSNPAITEEEISKKLENCEEFLAVKWGSAILDLIKKHEAVICDELDDVLKTKLQFIISLGTAKPVPKEESRLVTELILKLSEDKELNIPFDFLPNTITSKALSETEYDAQVVPKLLEWSCDMLQDEQFTGERAAKWKQLLKEAPQHLKNYLTIRYRTASNQELIDAAQLWIERLDPLYKDQLANLRQTILRSVPALLNSRYNADYILKKCGAVDLAVPAAGPGVPSETQFSSPFEVAIRTMAARIKLKKETENLREIREEILGELKHTAESINSTSQKLALSSGSFSGFTGTFWNISTMPKFSQQYPDDITEGKTYNRLLAKEKKGEISVKEVEGTTTTLLVEQIKKMQASVLIDTGGWLRNTTEEAFADTLLQEFGDRFEVVIFHNSKGEKSARTKGGETIPFDELKMSPEKRFTIYGKSHTVGTDIKQSERALGLLTMDKEMILRDEMQGKFRLRQLLENQQLRILVDPGTRGVMERKLSLSGPITLAQVIAFLVENQVEQILVDNYQSATQRADCYRELALRSQIIKHVQGAHFPKALKCFQENRKHFITGKSQHAWEEFGKIPEKVDREEKLLAERERYIQSVKELQLSPEEEEATKELILSCFKDGELFDDTLDSLPQVAPDAQYVEQGHIEEQRDVKQVQLETPIAEAPVLPESLSTFVEAQKIQQLQLQQEVQQIREEIEDVRRWGAIGERYYRGEELQQLLGQLSQIAQLPQKQQKELVAAVHQKVEQIQAQIEVLEELTVDISFQNIQFLKQTLTHFEKEQKEYADEQEKLMGAQQALKALLGKVPKREHFEEHVQQLKALKQEVQRLQKSVIEFQEQLSLYAQTENGFQIVQNAISKLEEQVLGIDLQEYFVNEREIIQTKLEQVQNNIQKKKEDLFFLRNNFEVVLDEVQELQKELKELVLHCQKIAQEKKNQIALLEQLSLPSADTALGKTLHEQYKQLKTGIAKGGIKLGEIKKFQNQVAQVNGAFSAIKEATNSTQNIYTGGLQKGIARFSALLRFVDQNIQKLEQRATKAVSEETNIQSLLSVGEKIRNEFEKLERQASQFLQQLNTLEEERVVLVNALQQDEMNSLQKAVKEYEIQQIEQLLKGVTPETYTKTRKSYHHLARTRADSLDKILQCQQEAKQIEEELKQIHQDYKASSGVELSESTLGAMSNLAIQNEVALEGVTQSLQASGSLEGLVELQEKQIKSVKGAIKQLREDVRKDVQECQLIEEQKLQLLQHLPQDAHQVIELFLREAKGNIAKKTGTSQASLEAFKALVGYLRNREEFDFLNEMHVVKSQGAYCDIVSDARLECFIECSVIEQEIEKIQKSVSEVRQQIGVYGDLNKFKNGKLLKENTLLQQEIADLEKLCTAKVQDCELQQHKLACLTKSNQVALLAQSIHAQVSQLQTSLTAIEKLLPLKERAEGFGYTMFVSKVNALLAQQQTLSASEVTQQAKLLNQQFETLLKNRLDIAKQVEVYSGQLEQLYSFLPSQRSAIRAAQKDLQQRHEVEEGVAVQQKYEQILNTFLQAATYQELLALTSRVSKDIQSKIEALLPGKKAIHQLAQIEKQIEPFTQSQGEAQKHIYQYIRERVTVCKRQYEEGSRVDFTELEQELQYLPDVQQQLEVAEKALQVPVQAGYPFAIDNRLEGVQKVVSDLSTAQERLNQIRSSSLEGLKIYCNALQARLHEVTHYQALLREETTKYEVLLKQDMIAAGNKMEALLDEQIQNKEYSQKVHEAAQECYKAAGALKIGSCASVENGLIQLRELHKQYTSLEQEKEELLLQQEYMKERNQFEKQHFAPRLQEKQRAILQLPRSEFLAAVTLLNSEQEKITLLEKSLVELASQKIGHSKLAILQEKFIADTKKELNEGTSDLTDIKEKITTFIQAKSTLELSLQTIEKYEKELKAIENQVAHLRQSMKSGIQAEIDRLHTLLNQLQPNQELFYQEFQRRAEEQLLVVQQKLKVLENELFDLQSAHKRLLQQESIRRSQAAPLANDIAQLQGFGIALPLNQTAIDDWIAAEQDLRTIEELEELVRGPLVQLKQLDTLKRAVGGTYKTNWVEKLLSKQLQSLETELYLQMAEKRVSQIKESFHAIWDQITQPEKRVVGGKEALLQQTLAQVKIWIKEAGDSKKIEAGFAQAESIVKELTSYHVRYTSTYTPIATMIRGGKIALSQQGAGRLEEKIAQAALSSLAISIDEILLGILRQEPLTAFVDLSIKATGVNKATMPICCQFLEEMVATIQEYQVSKEAVSWLEALNKELKHPGLADLIKKSHDLIQQVEESKEAQPIVQSMQKAVQELIPSLSLQQIELFIKQTSDPLHLLTNVQSRKQALIEKERQEIEYQKALTRSQGVLKSVQGEVHLLLESVASEVAQLMQKELFELRKLLVDSSNMQEVKIDTIEQQLQQLQDAKLMFKKRSALLQGRLETLKSSIMSLSTNDFQELKKLLLERQQNECTTIDQLTKLEEEVDAYIKSQQELQLAKELTSSLLEKLSPQAKQAVGTNMAKHALALQPIDYDAILEKALQNEPLDTFKTLQSSNVLPKTSATIQKLQIELQAIEAKESLIASAKLLKVDATQFQAKLEKARALKSAVGLFETKEVVGLVRQKIEQASLEELESMQNSLDILSSLGILGDYSTCLNAQRALRTSFENAQKIYEESQASSADLLKKIPAILKENFTNQIDQLQLQLSKTPKTTSEYIAVTNEIHTAYNNLQAAFMQLQQANAQKCQVAIERAQEEFLQCVNGPYSIFLTDEVSRLDSSLKTAATLLNTSHDQAQKFFEIQNKAKEITGLHTEVKKKREKIEVQCCEIKQGLTHIKSSKAFSSQAEKLEGKLQTILSGGNESAFEPLLQEIQSTLLVAERFDTTQKTAQPLLEKLSLEGRKKIEAELLEQFQADLQGSFSVDMLVARQLQHEPKEVVQDLVSIQQTGFEITNAELARLQEVYKAHNLLQSFDQKLAPLVANQVNKLQELLSQQVNQTEVAALKRHKEQLIEKTNDVQGVYSKLAQRIDALKANIAGITTKEFLEIKEQLGKRLQSGFTTVEQVIELESEVKSYLASQQKLQEARQVTSSMVQQLSFAAQSKVERLMVLQAVECKPIDYDAILESALHDEKLSLFAALSPSSLLPKTSETIQKFRIELGVIEAQEALVANAKLLQVDVTQFQQEIDSARVLKKSNNQLKENLQNAVRMKIEQASLEELESMQPEYTVLKAFGCLELYTSCLDSKRTLLELQERNKKEYLEVVKRSETECARAKAGPFSGMLKDEIFMLQQLSNSRDGSEFQERSKEISILTEQLKVKIGQLEQEYNRVEQYFSILEKEINTLPAAAKSRYMPFVQEMQQQLKEISSANSPQALQYMLNEVQGKIFVVERFKRAHKEAEPLLNLMSDEARRSIEEGLIERSHLQADFSVDALIAGNLKRESKGALEAINASKVIGFAVTKVELQRLQTLYRMLEKQKKLVEDMMLHVSNEVRGEVEADVARFFSQLSHVEAFIRQENVEAQSAMEVQALEKAVDDTGAKIVAAVADSEQLKALATGLVENRSAKALAQEILNVRTVLGNLFSTSDEPLFSRFENRRQELFEKLKVPYITRDENFRKSIFAFYQDFKQANRFRFKCWSYMPFTYLSERDAYQPSALKKIDELSQAAKEVMNKLSNPESNLDMLEKELAGLETKYPEGKALLDQVLLKKFQSKILHWVAEKDFDHASQDLVKGYNSPEEILGNEYRYVLNLPEFLVCFKNLTTSTAREELVESIQRSFESVYPACNETGELFEKIKEVLASYETGKLDGENCFLELKKIRSEAAKLERDAQAKFLDSITASVNTLKESSSNYPGVLRITDSITTQLQQKKPSRKEIENQLQLAHRARLQYVKIDEMTSKGLIAVEYVPQNIVKIAVDNLQSQIMQIREKLQMATFDQIASIEDEINRLQKAIDQQNSAFASMNESYKRTKKSVEPRKKEKVPNTKNLETNKQYTELSTKIVKWAQSTSQYYPIERFDYNYSGTGTDDFAQELLYDRDVGGLFQDIYLHDRDGKSANKLGDQIVEELLQLDPFGLPGLKELIQGQIAHMYSKEGDFATRVAKTCYGCQLILATLKDLQYFKKRIEKLEQLMETKIALPSWQGKKVSLLKQLGIVRREYEKIVAKNNILAWNGSGNIVQEINDFQKTYQSAELGQFLVNKLKEKWLGKFQQLGVQGLEKLIGLEVRRAFKDTSGMNKYADTSGWIIDEEAAEEIKYVSQNLGHHRSDLDASNDINRLDRSLHDILQIKELFEKNKNLQLEALNKKIKNKNIPSDLQGQIEELELNFSGVSLRRLDDVVSFKAFCEAKLAALQALSSQIQAL